MEILNQKWRVETTTYLNLIQKFDGEIGLDDSFNVGSLTEGRWESQKAIGFIRSVIRGIAMQDIYLVDLQSCLDNSVEGSEDWEYFKKWLDAGYKWLAVDGNNRTITCRNFFNDNIKIPSGEKFEVEVYGQKAKFKIKKGQNVWSNLPEELKKVISSQPLNIKIITKMTKEEIVATFRGLNDGVEFNSQEKRNSELTAVAAGIRKVGYEFDNKLGPLIGLGRKSIVRFAVHELVISCGVYYVNQEDPVTINSTAQDKEYKSNSKLENVLEPFMREVSECFNALLKAKFYIPKKQFKKVNVMNFWMFWNWLKNEGYNINNKRVTDLVKWFIETEIERRNSDHIILEKEKNSYTYGGLNTDGAKELDERLKAIIADFEISGLEEEGIVVSVDPRRIFTDEQRYKIWEKQGHKCPITNKEIPIHQVLRSDIWQADHIIEWSVGGETTVENGQLICVEAHKQKTANFNRQRNQPTLCPA